MDLRTPPDVERHYKERGNKLSRMLGCGNSHIESYKAIGDIMSTFKDAQKRGSGDDETQTEHDDDDATTDWQSELPEMSTDDDERPCESKKTNYKDYEKHLMKHIVKNFEDTFDKMDMFKAAKATMTHIEKHMMWTAIERYTEEHADYTLIDKRKVMHINNEIVKVMSKFNNKMQALLPLLFRFALPTDDETPWILKERGDSVKKLGNLLFQVEPLADVNTADAKIALLVDTVAKPPKPGCRVKAQARRPTTSSSVAVARASCNTQPGAKIFILQRLWDHINHVAISPAGEQPRQDVVEQCFLWGLEFLLNLTFTPIVQKPKTLDTTVSMKDIVKEQLKVRDGKGDRGMKPLKLKSKMESHLEGILSRFKPVAADDDAEEQNGEEDDEEEGEDESGSENNGDDDDDKHDGIDVFTIASVDPKHIKTMLDHINNIGSDDVAARIATIKKENPWKMLSLKSPATISRTHASCPKLINMIWQSATTDASELNLTAGLCKLEPDSTKADLTALVHLIAKCIWEVDDVDALVFGQLVANCVPENTQVTDSVYGFFDECPIIADICKAWLTIDDLHNFSKMRALHAVVACCELIALLSDVAKVQTTIAAPIAALSQQLQHTTAFCSNGGLAMMAAVDAECGSTRDAWVQRWLAIIECGNSLKGHVYTQKGTSDWDTLSELEMKKLRCKSLPDIKALAKHHGVTATKEKFDELHVAIVADLRAQDATSQAAFQTAIDKLLNAAAAPADDDPTVAASAETPSTTVATEAKLDIATTMAKTHTRISTLASGTYVDLNSFHSPEALVSSLNYHVAAGMAIGYLHEHATQPSGMHLVFCRLGKDGSTELMKTTKVHKVYATFVDTAIALPFVGRIIPRPAGAIESSRSRAVGHLNDDKGDILCDLHVIPETTMLAPGGTTCVPAWLVGQPTASNGAALMKEVVVNMPPFSVNVGNIRTITLRQIMLVPDTTAVNLVT